MSVANPPPIPPPPAGYWWRSLACLADIIPLMFLGWLLAGWLAGPEEITARKTADAWAHRMLEQYTLTIRHPTPQNNQTLMDMAQNPRASDLEAVATWMAHLGVTTFYTMLLALTLQEWLMRGTTLGKRMLNLRTIDVRTAAAPGFLDCMMRSACKSACFALPNPLITLVGIINFHIPLFRHDRRTWHDLWTKTQVVDLSKS